MLKHTSVYVVIFLFLHLITVHNTFSRNVLVEAKGGSFIPINKTFEEIHGHALPMGGVEVNVGLCKDVFAWASLAGLKKSGHSIGLENSTKITLLPIGFGLKYFYSVDCMNFDIYGGGGPVATYLKTNDFSPYVVQKHAKWAFGGVLKAGAMFPITDCLLIDLFADFSFVNMNFCASTNPQLYCRDAKLNGLFVGIGLARLFN